MPFCHGRRIVPEGAQIVSYRRLASNMACGLSCGVTGLAARLGAGLGVGLVAGLIALPSGAAAQSAEGTIGIELNSASDQGGACRLTYVITNGTTTDLTQASWEVAIHDAGGVVTQLWVLDFGSLPQGRTRVTQFDLADQPCAKLSRISVNDAVDCQSAEGAVTVCREKQSLSSRVEAIAFN
jgi:hypothetical protein